MAKTLWLVGGAALAAAAYLVMKQPMPNEAFENGAGADLAGKVGAWGDKQRVFGTGGQLKGKLEQGAGKLTGDPDLGDQGTFDEAKGAVKDAAGQAAHAVEDTINSLKS